MKLTDVFLMLILICSLISTIIMFDTWQMDKQFYNEMNQGGGASKNSLKSDEYV